MRYCLHKCFDQIEHKFIPIHIFVIYYMHAYIHIFIYTFILIHMFITFRSIHNCLRTQLIIRSSVFSFFFFPLCPFETSSTDRSSVWWLKSGSNLTCSAPSIGCFVGKSKFPFCSYRISIYFHSCTQCTTSSKAECYDYLDKCLNSLTLLVEQVELRLLLLHCVSLSRSDIFGIAVNPSDR